MNLATQSQDDEKIWNSKLHLATTEATGLILILEDQKGHGFFFKSSSYQVQIKWNIHVC